MDKVREEKVREEIEFKIFNVIQYVYAEPEWARQDSYKITAKILDIEIGGEVIEWCEKYPECPTPTMDCKECEYYKTRPRTIRDAIQEAI